MKGCVVMPKIKESSDIDIESELKSALEKESSFKYYRYKVITEDNNKHKDSALKMKRFFIKAIGFSPSKDSATYPTTTPPLFDENPKNPFDQEPPFSELFERLRQLATSDAYKDSAEIYTDKDAESVKKMMSIRTRGFDLRSFISNKLGVIHEIHETSWTTCVISRDVQCFSGKDFSVLENPIPKITVSEFKPDLRGHTGTPGRGRGSSNKGYEEFVEIKDGSYSLKINFYDTIKKAELIKLRGLHDFASKNNIQSTVSVASLGFTFYSLEKRNANGKALIDEDFRTLCRQMEAKARADAMKEFRGKFPDSPVKKSVILGDSTDFSKVEYPNPDIFLDTNRTDMIAYPEILEKLGDPPFTVATSIAADPAYAYGNGVFSGLSMDKKGNVINSGRPATAQEETATPTAPLGFIVQDSHFKPGILERIVQIEPLKLDTPVTHEPTAQAPEKIAAETPTVQKPEKTVAEKPPKTKIEELTTKINELIPRALEELNALTYDNPKKILNFLASMALINTRITELEKTDPTGAANLIESNPFIDLYRKNKDVLGKGFFTRSAIENIATSPTDFIIPEEIKSILQQLKTSPESVPSLERFESSDGEPLPPGGIPVRTNIEVPPKSEFFSISKSADSKNFTININTSFNENFKEASSSLVSHIDNIEPTTSTEFEYTIEFPSEKVKLGPMSKETLTTLLKCLEANNKKLTRSDCEEILKMDPPYSPDFKGLQLIEVDPARTRILKETATENTKATPETTLEVTPEVTKPSSPVKRSTSMGDLGSTAVPSETSKPLPRSKSTIF